MTEAKIIKNKSFKNIQALLGIIGDIQRVEIVFAINGEDKENGALYKVVL